ncbi:MAG: glycerophosphodiester phosphodiesterase [Candidatus Limnocylindrales bacterium]
MEPGRTILRLAHRGDWRLAPENSVAALVAGARATRSAGVEFDVRLAADGRPVLSHDADLLRVQGVPHAIGRLKAAALAAHGVALLSDALAAVPADAFLDVELKEMPNKAVAEALIDARGDTPARAVVSAFDPAALEKASTLLPGWPRWLNAWWIDAEVVAVAVGVGCAAIAAEFHAITPATARAAHEAGLDLVAWTVRRRPTLARLERLGVLAACVEGSTLDR